LGARKTAAIIDIIPVSNNVRELNLLELFTKTPLVLAEHFGEDGLEDVSAISTNTNVE